MTYSDTHSNALDDGRIIGIGRFNFPLQVNNLTWSLDYEASMDKTEKLREGHAGEFRFKLKLASTLSNYNSRGCIDLNLWSYNAMHMTGGFIETYGCEVTSASSASLYNNHTGCEPMNIYHPASKMVLLRGRWSRRHKIPNISRQLQGLSLGEIFIKQLPASELSK